MQSQRIAVPAGQIAAIVTYFEMRAPPADKAPIPGTWHLAAVPTPEIGWYKGLYRLIGAEWLWFSRLVMPEPDLKAALAANEVYALQDAAGRDIGLLELDRRQSGEVEIAFFGVVAAATGTGAAAYLMQEAFRLAWTADISRVWLHTCTLDHPAAVKFYVKAGFTAYKRVVEIDDDPRLNGALPLSAGAHAPPIVDKPEVDYTGDPGK